jgi:Arc/MetJ-type ribon-helix-helix transcriptional regulator
MVIPNGTRSMKTISLKLTENLLRRLERTAQARGQSKSEVVRTALEQFLNGERSIAAGSALEAVLPWVGCCEGPGDLSTNRKYMAGFGE